MCNSFENTVLECDKRGFLHPMEADFKKLEEICPAAGIHTAEMDRNNIWGRNLGVYLGYSNEPQTRRLCSSGGLLTEIAAYLLESGKVDLVIHTKAKVGSPTETVACTSRTRDDLLSGAGSRYSISHPLDIIKSIDNTKRYAFIGKPCDVVTLRNYFGKNPKLKETILYLLSFFCMGVPSIDAQKKLLARLECADGCRSLIYRGNGWPGFTVGVDKDNVSHTIDYNSSWGEILGRDLMPACRFCIDGIGEMADISCGDAWYIRDGKPDFSEHEGRNVVFARTELGARLLKEVNQRGTITLEGYDNYLEEMLVIQKSQLIRRKSMKYRIAALRLCFQPYPRYRRQLLDAYATSFNNKMKAKTLLGTVNRIITHKI